MGFKKNTEPCKVKEKECPDLSNCELQDIGNVDTGNLQDGDVLCFLNGEWTNVPKNLSKVAYKETLDSDPDDGFKEIVLYYVDDNGPVIGSEFSFTVPDSTEIPDDVVTYVFNPLPNGGVSAEAFDVSGVSLGVQTLGSDDQTASEVPALDEDGQETTVQACLDDVKQRVSALEAKPDNSVASATIINDVITITEDNGDTHTVSITHPPTPDEEGVYLDGVNAPILDVAAKTLTYSTVIDEGEAAGTPIVLDLTPMFNALTSPDMPTFTGNAVSFNAATNTYTITDTDTTIADTDTDTDQWNVVTQNPDGSTTFQLTNSEGNVGNPVTITPTPSTEIHGVTVTDSSGSDYDVENDPGGSSRPLSPVVGAFNKEIFDNGVVLEWYTGVDWVSCYFPNSIDIKFCDESTTPINDYIAPSIMPISWVDSGDGCTPADPPASCVDKEIYSVNAPYGTQWYWPAGGPWQQVGDGNFTFCDVFRSEGIFDTLEFEGAENNALQPIGTIQVNLPNPTCKPICAVIRPRFHAEIHMQDQKQLTTDIFVAPVSGVSVINVANPTHQVFRRRDAQGQQVHDISHGSVKVEIAPGGGVVEVRLRASIINYGGPALTIDTSIRQGIILGDVHSCTNDAQITVTPVSV